MTTSSLLTTKVLQGFINGLKANNCEVDRNREAGTVTVFDGDHRVLVAIQKGRDAPWIVRFIDSDRIKWTVADAEK